MSEEDARAAMASGAQCVRYLYDHAGAVVHGGPPRDAFVVPAAALLSKRARRRWLAIASVAALPVLLEACGPGDAPYERSDASAPDGEDEDAAFTPADARVRDGSAGDGGDGAL